MAVRLAIGPDSGLKRCGDSSRTTRPAGAAASQHRVLKQVAAGPPAAIAHVTVAHVICGLQAGPADRGAAPAASGSGAAFPRFTRAEPVAPARYSPAPSAPPRQLAGEGRGPQQLRRRCAAKAAALFRR